MKLLAISLLSLLIIGKTMALAGANLCLAGKQERLMP